MVAQTLRDCLDEAMDAPGWLALLRRMESGEVEVIARDVPAPSPFALEALSARPYAFLDDAPIEERRTQAVQAGRHAEATSADDLGRLDADAIASVREEAWPAPRNADEMHEALVTLGVVEDDEVAANPAWSTWLVQLAQACRAARLPLPRAGEGRGEGALERTGLWVAAERLATLRLVHPDATCEPDLHPLEGAVGAPTDRDEALRDLLRARLGGLGPTPAAALAASLHVDVGEVERSLVALQSEGFVLQGRFSVEALAPDAPIEWCERHLLARVHRYTLKRLRREIEPVEPRDFVRFLFEWQRVGAASRVRGPDALAGVLAQLEGFEAPAPVWEADLLPARVQDYSSAWLDELCTAGRTLWTRLRPLAGEGRGATTSLRSTPILLLPRRSAASWSRLAPAPGDDSELGARARAVADHLAARGASFFDEVAGAVRLLPAEVEDALAELVARGRVNCDSYAGLRALLVPPSKRASAQTRRRRGVSLSGIADAGRWSLIRSVSLDEVSRADRADAVEHAARILLRRYGVVGWRLLEREAGWLPPWRDLVRAWRRLEARGEIRGGRFIAGLSGEQFALPEAVAVMREVRRRPLDGEWICVAASDPANLLGTVLPGPKVARVPNAYVLYRDGVPVATRIGDEVALLSPVDASERATVEHLLRRHRPTEASMTEAAIAAAGRSRPVSTRFA